MSKNERLTTRESGIELLRILAMVMIIAHHFAVHASWPQTHDLLGSNLYIIELFRSLGKIGAGIFFCIFGYFLQKSDRGVHPKKIMKIIGPTWFYSFFILSLFLISGKYPLSFALPVDSLLVKSIFPIFFNSYWFVSSYIVLELLSDILKKALNAISNKELTTFFSIYIMFCWVAGGLGFFISDAYSAVISVPSSILYASLGMFIARTENHIRTKTIILLLFIACAILLVAPIIVNVLAENGYSYISDLFWRFDSPFCMIASCCLLIIFGRIKIKNRIVNYIGGLTFGIYLIHDNNLIRQELWSKIDTVSWFYANKIKFTLYAAAIVACVFMICAIIEAFRKYVVSIIEKTIGLRWKTT